MCQVTSLPPLPHVSKPKLPPLPHVSKPKLAVQVLCLRLLAYLTYNLLVSLQTSILSLTPSASHQLILCHLPK
uniref:Putative ovule protein n=1 Tax=Solanum chacoense TaxID=4108 RepID=A0A0V0HC54_SOLCH